MFHLDSECMSRNWPFPTKQEMLYQNWQDSVMLLEALADMFLPRKIHLASYKVWICKGEFSNRESYPNQDCLSFFWNRQCPFQRQLVLDRMRQRRSARPRASPRFAYPSEPIPSSPHDGLPEVHLTWGQRPLIQEHREENLWWRSPPTFFVESGYNWIEVLIGCLGFNGVGFVMKK